MLQIGTDRMEQLCMDGADSGPSARQSLKVLRHTAGREGIGHLYTDSVCTGSRWGLVQDNSCMGLPNDQAIRPDPPGPRKPHGALMQAHRLGLEFI